MAEPKQRTKTGYEIPVPTREQVLSNFAKAAQPVPEKPERSRRMRSAGK